MVADTVLSAPSPDRALRHGRLEGCPMLLYRFIAVIGSEEVPIIHRRDPSPRRVPFRWSCDYLVLLSERARLYRELAKLALSERDASR